MVRYKELVELIQAKKRAQKLKKLFLEKEQIFRKTIF